MSGNLLDQHRATVEIERLQRFKDSVHGRLDKEGIPVDPPGKHRDAGCRIGQRLDVVFTGVEQLQVALRFCRDITAEEYDHQQTNLGAELVLRHIMRKCDEALLSTGWKPRA